MIDVLKMNVKELYRIRSMTTIEYSSNQLNKPLPRGLIGILLKPHIDCGQF